jgi:hypothetical protein
LPQATQLKKVVGSGETDFSGHWILVNPSAATVNAPQGMMVRQSLQRESVTGGQVDPPLVVLTIDRLMAGGVTQTERYSVGTVGGIVAGTSDSPRPTQASRFSTAWEGGSLVIDTWHSERPEDAGGDSEHKEVWSLSSDGTLLVSVVDRVAGREPTTTSLTYRRAEEGLR